MRQCAGTGRGILCIAVRGGDAQQGGEGPDGGISFYASGQPRIGTRAEAARRFDSDYHDERGDGCSRPDRRRSGGGAVFRKAILSAAS